MRAVWMGMATVLLLWLCCVATGVEGARSQQELKECGKVQCNSKGPCVEGNSGNITGCDCTSNGFAGSNCQITYHEVLGEAFDVYSYTTASIFVMLWVWTTYELVAWTVLQDYKQFNKTPLVSLVACFFATLTRFLFYFLDPVDSWGNKGLIDRWLLEVLFSFFFGCIINMYGAQLLTWIRVSRKATRVKREISMVTKYLMGLAAFLVMVGQLVIAVLLGTVEDPDETAGVTLALFVSIGLYAFVIMCGFVRYGSALGYSVYTNAKKSGLRYDFGSSTGKLLIQLTRTTAINTIFLTTSIVLVSVLAITGIDRDPQVWLTTRWISRVLEAFMVIFSVISVRLLRLRQAKGSLSRTAGDSSAVSVGGGNKA